MSDYDNAIAEVLDEFREVYGMNLTEFVCKAFSEALEGCTAKEVTWSALQHLKSSKFAPRPAELLGIVKAKRELDSVQSTRSDFWKQAEEARKNRCTSGYNKPDGVSVLEHYQNLLASGMSKEDALKEMCG